MPRFNFKKTLNIHHIKSLSVLGVSQVLFSIIGFLATLIWANMGSKEDYGIYLVLMSYIPIVGLFAYAGSTTSLEISSSKGIDGNLVNILKKKFKAGMMCTFCFIGFIAYHIVRNDDFIVIGSVAVLALLFPFRVVSDSWIPWANGKRDFSRYASYKVIQAFLILVITYCCLIFVHDGAIIAVIIIFFYTLASFYFLRYYIRTTSNTEICADSINYGKAISGAFVLNGLLLFDKMLIGLFVGLDDVAIYAVSLAFATIIKQSFDVINKVITPKLASFSNVNEGWEWFRYLLYLVGFSYTLVAFIGLFLMDWVIVLLFGEKYLASIEFATCFWILTCLAIPSSMITSFLRLQGKVRYVYVVANSNASLKLACIFFLTPFWGLWGVVAAHLVSLFVVTLVSVVFLNRYKNLDG